MSKKERVLAPSWVTICRAVGWVTLLEVIRDKVLYNIILCAFLIFGVGFLASRLSYAQPERVILDFGLSAVNISCSMIAILTGSGLLAKEIDRRTIFVALSHPISRPQFVVGKFVGLFFVLALNWILISLVYLALTGWSSEQIGQTFSFALFASLFLILVQSSVLASVAVLFSTFSTTSLSAILGLGIYLIGNNISQIRLVASKLNSRVGGPLLNGVASFLPNLEHFNLGTKVTYGLPVGAQWVLTATLYGIGLTSLFIAFAGFLINLRDI